MNMHDVMLPYHCWFCSLCGLAAHLGYFELVCGKT